MIIDKKQEDAFWDAIGAFQESGLLNHIMIIGSWAEYLYTNIFSDGYEPNIRTRDVDCFYPNIKKPKTHIDLFSALSTRGFKYDEDPFTRVGRFVKENLIEISFLSRTLGSEQNGPRKIEALKIYSEGIRDVNILERYPFHIKVKDYELIVPEPAIFIVQKLLVYPVRHPEYKKEKDLRSVKELLPYINASEEHSKRLNTIIGTLSEKEKKLLKQVGFDNNIVLEI